MTMSHESIKEAETSNNSKIKQSYPNHSIGEEGGIVAGDDDTNGSSNPLDATTNFIKGIPHFASLFHLMHKGRLDQAVVVRPHS